MIDDAEELEQREAAQEQARKAAELRERTKAEDIERIMQTPWGRRFVWSLLEDCHLLSTSYRLGEPVEDAVFRDGERNIGLNIMGRINRVCPDLYAVMAREATEKATQ